MSANKTNHVGEKVGIYDIVELMPYKLSDGHAAYKGICSECGYERYASYSDLKKAKICNHISIDGSSMRTVTKWNNERIHSIFSDMKKRCYNLNSKSYRWYGAKGIKIYQEWMNNPALFEEWALNNGYADNLTINRKDESKDYCPDNCEWITLEENSRFKSTTSLINVDGETHTGREWSGILGLNINIINKYIRVYGLNNTIEFIKKYRISPNLKRRDRKQSFYDLYMNTKQIQI